MVRINVESVQAVLLYDMPALLSGYAQVTMGFFARLQKSIEPDIQWSLLYMLFTITFYLFHSPFRTRRGVPLDTYARVTRMLQTLSLVSIVCFHVAPEVVRQKSAQLVAHAKIAAATESSGTKEALDTAASAEVDASLAGIVLFPVFFTTICLFSLIHKMKRQWHMVVTYGSSATMILMNSLIISVLAIMHYTYSRRIFFMEEAVRPSVLGSPFARNDAGVRNTATVLNGLYSFLLHRVVRLIVVTPSAAHRPFLVIVKLQAFSLLFMWADYLYKKRQGGDPSRGILWADLYDQHKYRTLSEEQADARARERGVLGWRERWRKVFGSRNKEVMDWRELEPRPMAFSKPASPQRNRSRPTDGSDGDTGSSQARSSVASHRHTSSLAGLLSRLPLLYNEMPANWSLLSPGSDACGHTTTTTTATGGDDADMPSTATTASPGPLRLARTALSFQERSAHIAKMSAAKHPTNKPGMVPWWSVFSLGTAVQSALGASLRFLSFDVRTIQGLATPKIFDLHFLPDVKYLYDCDDATDDEGAMAAVAPQGSARSARSLDGPLSASTAASPRGYRDAKGSEAPPTDVWFDWVADVGDGFNPTYEIARLMAQPVLSVNSGASALGSNQLGCTSHLTDEDYVCDVFPSGSALLDPRRGQGRPAMTRRGSAPAMAPGSPTVAARQGSGGDAWASSTMVVTSLTSPACDGASATATPGQPAAGRRGRSSSSRLPAAEVLPRGSFTLVGGDLAYPNPSDETYRTRLFDPYEDAFPGSLKLKRLFHAHQREVVSADAADPDVAHIAMLDAVTVTRRVMRGGSANFGRAAAEEEEEEDNSSESSHMDEAAGAAGARGKRSASDRARVTAAEALHSIPMLFSIPGNHDWIDTLTTFRKWMIEKTWIGGRFMPQRSSFFLLKLPHNWFVICMDTGSDQDINTAQRNYFLHAIETHMNAESCVILTCHEPGWLFNAMEHRTTPLQPEVDAVARHLGTRMRLRLAGDIHNYSRHVPLDPLSEAATLIVSGGGGAYMYGARDDCVIEQGTRYMRAGAFPRNNTYMSMASRLWGFRVINWKADLIIGLLCFGIIYSALPVPVSVMRKLTELSRQQHAPANAGEEAGASLLADVTYVFFSLLVQVWYYLLNNGLACFIPIGLFFSCFSSAGSDRKVSLPVRALYGGLWTCTVVVSCAAAISMLNVVITLLSERNMTSSTVDRWESAMDNELRASTDAFWTHLRNLLGNRDPISHTIAAVQDFFYGPGQWIVQIVSVVVRALDPLETLYYLSLRVTHGVEQFGRFAEDVTRLQVTAYYGYILFYYWIIVTPIVSFIIGLFLFISSTCWDLMYDGNFSAMQIEEFKHFLRFRIDARTRKLHGYVVAEKNVPKLWELNRSHVEEMATGERRGLPPHLRFHPSRWIPSLTKRERAARGAASANKPAPAEVLEHFVIDPHRTAQRSSSPTGAAPTTRTEAATV